MIGYLKYFIKDRRVASVVPTRRKIVEQICSGIDFTTAHAIVEYGPGLGVITQHLLKHLAQDARVILFETNREMMRDLGKRITDQRLTALNRNALEVVSALPGHLHGEVDAVISGIPLSMLSQHDRRRLLDHTHQVLRPGGQMVIYQVIPLLNNVIGYNLRPDLERVFGTISQRDATLSLPPLRIYRAVK